jgi:hypothetical protein
MGSRRFVDRTLDLGGLIWFRRTEAGQGGLYFVHAARDDEQPGWPTWSTASEGRGVTTLT